MARKGALSPKTLFPRTGDTFEDAGNRVCWECVRSHTFVEDRKRTRYALLKGYVDDDVLWMAVHDFDRAWLSHISAITRSEEEGYKRYTWRATTTTWQET
jgi:hypothetical protein